MACPIASPVICRPNPAAMINRRVSLIRLLAYANHTPRLSTPVKKLRFRMTLTIQTFRFEE